MNILVFLLTALLAWMPTGSSAQSVALSLQVEPPQPVNGSPVLFRVRADKPLKTLSGLWLGHRVFFEFDPASGDWCGFAGVELGASAGARPLKLDYVLANGARSTSIQSVTVAQASYRSSTVTVAPRSTASSASAISASCSDENATPPAAVS